MEQQNKICAAMYDEEKDDHKLITNDVKKDIAETTQTSMEEVNKVLFAFKNLKQMHGWLRAKH